MESGLAEKYGQLKERMERLAPEGIAMAFSGGVDSALLLKIACMAVGDCGTVYAVTVQTKLHPAKDLETAERMAGEFGAVHRVLQMDELAEAGIETNPVDRCYRCKKSIFQKIKQLAQELGTGCILEGTNADDLSQYRPGIRALKELDIISPLAECGFTKKEVRALARHLGIPAAERPSAPCLATRLPYGMTIRYELLEKIDEGEQFLKTLGFYNVRLRVHDLTEEVNAGPGGEKWSLRERTGQAARGEDKNLLARIEVDRKDLPRLLENREGVVEKIKGLGFRRVTVDLEGFRSGSMDEPYIF